MESPKFRIERWLATARRETWLGFAIVLLAFALRVTHVLAMRSSPDFDAPQMDAAYHVAWARAVAAGETFQSGPFFRAPLYPWFLAGILRLCGDDLLIPRLVQAALGAVTTWFVWRIARHLFGPLAGLVAALAIATHWVSIFYDGELLLESLCTPLYCAALWASVRLDQRPNVARAGLAGVLWGLGAITRPNVLLLFPLLCLWSARRHRAQSRFAPLVLALSLAAPIAPITLYNAVEGGDRVLISSQSGVNLWIGNNPASDGTSAVVPGTREDWWGGYYDAIALAEREAGRPLRPSEVSAHYTAKAVAFAREQPLDWLRLTLRKVRLFWLDWELGNNEEVRFVARHFSPLMRVLPVGFGLLAAAAVVGVWVVLQKRRPAFPLLGFTVLFSASVVAYFVNARFRVPLLPALAVLAGVGLIGFWELWIERRWKSVFLTAGLASLSLVISFAAPAGMEQRSLSNGHMMLGAAALRARDFERATDEYRRALEANARNWIARRGLAEARYFAGDLEEAKRMHRAVLSQKPDDAFAWEGLGRVHFKLGELDDAARCFAASAAASPAFFDSWYSLGVVELTRGRNAEAGRAFEAALEAAPPVDTKFLLESYQRAVGCALAEGRQARAVELARQGLERFPDDAALRSVLP